MQRIDCRLFRFACCAILTVAIPAVASGQGPLTLDDCVSRALTKNPQINQARRQLHQSELQRRQAGSALLPTVSLNGAFSRYTSVSPQQLLNPATNQIVEGSATAITSMSYYSGINIAQPLFNRSVTSLYAQALASEEIAKSGEAFQRQQIVLMVHQAYYGLLRAQRNLEVAIDDVDYNSELLRQIEIMHSLGNRAKVDVLRQESALAQAQQRLITAENGVESTRADLNYVMGEDPTLPLDIVDDLEFKSDQVSLEKSLEEAFQAHPSLKQALLGITVAEAGIQAAAANRYPSINLSGNYSWRGDSYIDFTDAFSKDYTWSVGVGLYFSIFDGMRTRYNIQRARIDLEGAEVDKETTERTVSRDVHKAVLDLKEAEQILQTSERAVELAREALRLSEERYKLGAGTLLEVNASRLDMVTAQYQGVQALFNLKVARASLDFAMGHLR